MKITNNYNIDFNNQKSAKSTRKDSLLFQGRFHAVKNTSFDIPYAYTNGQTAILRDLPTKEFVLRQIERLLANHKNVKMLVGACSTGEEAYFYSMMTKVPKEKFQIIGFDLSPDFVEEAKSGKILMQYIKDENITTIGSSVLNDDRCLCVSPQKPNSSEKKYRKTFNSFFKPLNIPIPPEVRPETVSKSYKIMYEMYTGRKYPEIQCKYFGLRNGKADNIKFVTGDIQDFSDVTGEEKADIITFSHAMYHLITKSNADMTRTLLPDAMQRITSLLESIKTSLKHNGLLVIGENEANEIFDSSNILIPIAMKKCGFEPIFIAPNKQVYRNSRFECFEQRI